MIDKIINIDSLKYYNDKINQTKQDVLVSGQNIKTINGESILGSGDLEIGDSIPIVSFPNFTSGTLDESESAKFSNIPEIFIAIYRRSQSSFEYLLFSFAGSSTSEDVYRYISYAEDCVYYFLELDRNSRRDYTITQTDLALKSDIPDTSNFATKNELSSKQDTIADLETIRQGAAKGATALQSYTEQYKGTVTGVKINGTTKNPLGGVVDLGNVITAHQTLKTINGESIVGSGDLEINEGNPDANVSAVDTSETLDDVETNTYVKYVAQTLTEQQKAQVRANIGISNSTGGITGGTTTGNGAYSEVNHGTNDITFTLTPNTFHIWDEVSSLTLTLGDETSGVANEYLFQFTSGATATSLTLPDTIKWSGGETPTIEANMIYQVSILKGLGSVLSWDNAKVLIDNLCTYDGSVTVTFQYPVASDVVVYIGESMSMAETITVSIGETTGTMSGMPGLGSSILGISPTKDDTYNYIF